MTGTQRFLSDLKSQCKSNGVQLILLRTKTVPNGGVRCCGTYGNKEITVGKKNPNWLAVLVHESCHMDQEFEMSSLWDREAKFGNTILDKWLMGREVKNLKKSIHNIISLELDCERRALKKIAYYDLPINTITYVQKANAYLLYYKYVEIVRRWEPAPETWDVPEVYLKMPKRYMSDRWYKKKLPEKYFKIFEACNL